MSTHDTSITESTTARSCGPAKLSFPNRLCAWGEWAHGVEAVHCVPVLEPRQQQTEGQRDERLGSQIAGGDACIFV